MDFVTVSTARAHLGRLVDRVLNGGEPIVIRRGSRFVQISEYVGPKAIPQRPAGFFAVLETRAEYSRANQLARLSPEMPE
jgi:hypothetical protein